MQGYSAGSKIAQFEGADITLYSRHRRRRVPIGFSKPPYRPVWKKYRLHNRANINLRGKA